MTEQITVVDPATEEVLAELEAADGAAVDAAVRRAGDAADPWRWLSANERAELLHEAARLTVEHTPELVELLCAEQGKPRPEQEEELEWAATTLRYYAELGRNSRGRVVPSGEPRTQLNLVIKEPYGIVAAIVPWNYPLLLLSWKLAPALAAGNVVLAKPSELTPLATQRWIDTCFAHFPPDVVQVLVGGGATGQALVEHPAVRVIAFTGSVATGQTIAATAAPMMKHLHLELGGKDAFVIAPDADVEASVDALAYAALLNAGQVCTSSERIYVPQDKHDDIVGALEAKVSTLRLGPGSDANTDIGPLINAATRDKVERHVADAQRRGATVVVGGRRPETFDRGFFYEPTVLADVDNDMLIMSEETFGPTIPVMAYRSFDDAIRWVNGNPLGLGATLRSTDPALCKRFFEEVKAGTIWINDPLTDNYAGPFGGMKLTGGGRELGEEGLETFSETKHVHWDFSDQPKEWWYPY